MPPLSLLPQYVAPQGQPAQIELVQLPNSDAALVQIPQYALHRCVMDTS